MKSVVLHRCPLSAYIAAAILVGCGGSQSSIAPSGWIPQSVATATQTVPHRLESSFGQQKLVDNRYKVLHSFGKGIDGVGPEASLLDVNSTLYGTTSEGGVYGAGTVFSISTKGSEKVLHSFGSNPDGANDPIASLIYVNGMLYGTTAGGGVYGYGTVFSSTLTGKINVLHYFGNGTDGRAPYAGLTNVNGILYGTTNGGGANGDGTVFSITTSGTEKVLHDFGKGTDGSAPYAGLTNVNGTLYGTTLSGGTSSGSTSEEGTVFSITTSGTEKVLHNFGETGFDGAFPRARLIDINNTLYGTTQLGGGTASNGDGEGTVFSITTSGTEKVLYPFLCCSSGIQPLAGLVDVKGTLYGTTYAGGADDCYEATFYGCGAVFSVNTSGKEKVLHAFLYGPSDGAYPRGSLIDVKGTLYGTTSAGGEYGKHGDGTVFALTP